MALKGHALFINKVVEISNYFCTWSQEIICIKIDLGVDVERYEGFRENQRLFIGRLNGEKPGLFIGRDSREKLEAINR